MSFYGYHGVTAAEKETGRRFEVDCELEVDLADAGQSDRLADTIDYGRVYETIREVVEGRAFSLIEGLASSLAHRLLEEFPAYRVTLWVRKMNPPIPGNIKAIEIEITRFQSDPAKLVSNEKE